MASWDVFERSNPEMAATGRRLLCQYGTGLGYLATVRKDGGPRLHPICPLIGDGRLVALIGRSPKRDDLLRDGRFALHTFPCQDVDDEFYLTGRARRRDDAALSAAVRATFATPDEATMDELLFEFDIEHAMLATYKPRGTPNNFPPRYTKWHAPTASGHGEPSPRHELVGGNMDIDLIPNPNLNWTRELCPWNVAEGTNAHKCAVKDVSICRHFRGIRPPDTVVCMYPGTTGGEQ